MHVATKSSAMQPIPRAGRAENLRLVRKVIDQAERTNPRSIRFRRQKSVVDRWSCGRGMQRFRGCVAHWLRRARQRSVDWPVRSSSSASVESASHECGRSAEHSGWRRTAGATGFVDYQETTLRHVHELLDEWIAWP